MAIRQEQVPPGHGSGMNHTRPRPGSGGAASASDPGTGLLSALGLPDRMQACSFDLEGVLTQTAKAHAAAWKEMFDLTCTTAPAWPPGRSPCPARWVTMTLTWTASPGPTARVRSSALVASYCPKEAAMIRPAPRRPTAWAAGRTRSCGAGSARTACRLTTARSATSPPLGMPDCAGWRCPPARTARTCSPRPASGTCPGNGWTA